LRNGSRYLAVTSRPPWQSKAVRASPVVLPGDFRASDDWSTGEQSLIVGAFCVSVCDAGGEGAVEVRGYMVAQVTRVQRVVIAVFGVVDQQSGAVNRRVVGDGEQPAVVLVGIGGTGVRRSLR
jgi:hypothetical protein